MLVELFVYDLSKGMARQFSAALTGVQIDAIYHTAIVMGGVEYTYDAGVRTVRPGSTHLGKPMQILQMGETRLPEDTILEYLDSLREIYTAEVRLSDILALEILNKHRLMTFGHITAIASPMTFLPFSSAKASRRILGIFLRPSSTPPLVE